MHMAFIKITANASVCNENAGKFDELSVSASVWTPYSHFTVVFLWAEAKKNQVS